MFGGGREHRRRDDDDDDDDDDDACPGESESEEELEEEPPAAAAPRKSSRSTAFRGGMKDPSNSIADLLKSAHPTTSDDGVRGRRGARQRSSLETRSSTDDDDGDAVVACGSPPAKRTARKRAVVKSPAKRHSKRRMTKRVAGRGESSDEEDKISSEEEEDDDEEDDDEDNDDDDEEDDDGEEEEEIKISKIIACRSMTLSEWRVVCTWMNTTEITNGSRWIQEDSVAPSPSTTSGAGDAGDRAAASGPVDKYEERFLVKWDDLSYLHCSWETERDLVEFCDGAKLRLSTFFRKAEGGLLYVADERLDGVSCVYNVYFTHIAHCCLQLHMLEPPPLVVPNASVFWSPTHIAAAARQKIVHRITSIHRGSRSSGSLRCWIPTTTATGRPRSSLTWTTRISTPAPAGNSTSSG